MLLHFVVLAGRQRSWLVQQPIGNRQLADVVQLRSGVKRAKEPLVGDIGAARQLHREPAHAVGVLVRRAIAHSQRTLQRTQRGI